jgi:hypothetical protein
VLDKISRSSDWLTPEIFCSTLEINSIFPHIHVLFSIYILGASETVYIVDFFLSAAGPGGNLDEEK